MKALLRDACALNRDYTRFVRLWNEKGEKEWYRPLHHPVRPRSHGILSPLRTPMRSLVKPMAQLHSKRRKRIVKSLHAAREFGFQNKMCLSIFVMRSRSVEDIFGFGLGDFEEMVNESSNREI